MLLLATCLLLAPKPIPNGAYGVPELCKLLTESTGVSHASGPLHDYSVMISTKSGDPKRIESLLARAMNADWVTESGKLRLAWKPVDHKAAFAEFQRQLLASTTEKSPLRSIPAKDLYELLPGHILRYSSKPSPYAAPLPASIAKANPEGTVLIRRFTYGAFETRLALGNLSQGPFDLDAGINFKKLPPEVETLLKDDLDTTAFTKEEQAAIQATASPDKMGIDWKKLLERDPIAIIAQPISKGLSTHIHTDFAIALPDPSLMGIGLSGGFETPTVRKALEGLSIAIRWASEDGALIGKLPVTERAHPTQVDRVVLNKFIQQTKNVGVASIAPLSEYVAAQKPGASECWMDAVMLVLAQIVIDEQYVGDYPFNVRLHTALTESDWNVLRSQATLNQLSDKAQAQVQELLIQSRERMDTHFSDPAFWPSLRADQIGIKAELEEKPILLMHAGMNQSVSTTEEAARDYDSRKRYAKTEPLYKTGMRKKLKLTLFSITQPTLTVETGFSEVTPDPKSTFIPWTKLPPAIAKTFELTLKGMPEEAPATAVPPPATIPPRNP